MIGARTPEVVSHVEAQTHWASRALLLWSRRRTLARVTAISLVVSLVIAFLIPKQYKSSASIMPPEEQGSRALMMAALASHAGSLGALGGLAGSLMGGHSSTALFEDLLQSGTVSDHLITRFNLQHVYRERYRVDAAKRLARRTKITEDKKSGVITITVEDTSRVRARDITQAYLDELNSLVIRTNTSAAHRERVFIEQRLHSVRADLEQAEVDLSRFASKSSVIDIKEQSRAMVDAGAQLQGQLLVEQAGLDSLRQIYGDSNIRVRQSEARIASLRKQLAAMAGASNSPADAIDGADTAPSGQNKDELYPPLRQMPRLAVPYSDLYRRVRVEEAMFEFLNQQYEVARIEEAKDIPTVSVIDAPGIPEKKSFPPRILLTLVLTLLSFTMASALILARHHWAAVDERDPRKMLGVEVLAFLRARTRRVSSWKRTTVGQDFREESKL